MESTRGLPSESRYGALRDHSRSIDPTPNPARTVRPLTLGGDFKRRERASALSCCARVTPNSPSASLTNVYNSTAKSSAVCVTEGLPVPRVRTLSIGGTVLERRLTRLDSWIRPLESRALFFAPTMIGLALHGAVVVDVDTNAALTARLFLATGALGSGFQQPIESFA
jgi:hypothetical protein